MTDPTPQPAQRQIPVEGLLGRYRDELAEKTQALFVAQASLETAEEECAALRLQLAHAGDATR